MKIPEKIAAMDKYFQNNHPSKLSINQQSGDPVEGRFIYSERPSGLYGQFDPEAERIPNVEEIVKLRLAAMHDLSDAIPELNYLEFGILNEEPENIKNNIEIVRNQAANLINDIWRVRLTTSTHMVRGNNSGEDTVFFYSGSPYKSTDSASQAMDGQLSDGGIYYDESALTVVQNDTPLDSQISFDDYLAARGGNFSGKDFLNHPIFSHAIGNRDLMEQYVYALQVLNLVDFYHAGLHSGWRPGEMKPGYGRPVALGHKGEAFYPPNNSTVGHCALVIPKETEIIL